MAMSICGTCTNNVHHKGCVTCFTVDEDGVTLPFPSNYVQKEKETVNHPNHYKTSEGLEAIDVIKAFTSDLTGIEAFDTGNALKYLCRWKFKNGVEDLKKAKWYIEHLINYIEKENDLS